MAGDDISESKLHPIFAIYLPNCVRKATDRMAGDLHTIRSSVQKWGKKKESLGSLILYQSGRSPAFKGTFLKRRLTTLFILSEKF